MENFKDASPRAVTGAREIGIAFCFAFLHQRLRGRTDDAHVESKGEAKVLVFCIVSIERWRFAKALKSSLHPKVPPLGSSALLRGSLVHQGTGSATMYDYKMTV